MTDVDLIAALGSSFAAGPGIPPYEDAAAMRSQRNYPHLVARHLGAELRDLTVSGATTANILHTPQTTLEGAVFAPQIGGVPAGADLVLITAGGNDLQFIGAMLHEAWARADPGGPLATMLADEFPHGIPAPTAARIEAMSRGLSDVVAAVRERASGARVLLVDYLTVLTEESADAVRELFTADQVEGLLRLQGGIVRGFEDAAARSGAQLLRVSRLSRDHALGSQDPWVSGFERSLEATSGSFHPNARGMEAVADAVAAAVRD